MVDGEIFWYNVEFIFVFYIRVVVCVRCEILCGVL